MKWMDQATQLASCSPATLEKVGCVIVRGEKIIALGYNAINISEPEETVDGVLQSKPECLHAEEFCIGVSANYGEALGGTTMYVTTAPCFRCARLIWASGIKTVYYRHAWWDRNAALWLKSKGVRVIHCRLEN
jgi:dCMP deaminase